MWDYWQPGFTLSIRIYIMVRKFRYQSDHRWMFTPAASAEWNLKNHFFTGSTALSGLSLRASYAYQIDDFKSFHPICPNRYELGPQYLATSITWSGEPLLSSANGFATITRPYASGWVGYDLKLPYSDKMELDTN